jgi:hypothetical protein
MAWGPSRLIGKTRMPAGSNSHFFVTVQVNRE